MGTIGRPPPIEPTGTSGIPDQPDITRVFDLPKALPKDGIAPTAGKKSRIPPDIHSLMQACILAGLNP